MKLTSYIRSALLAFLIGKALHLLAYWLINCKRGTSYTLSEEDANLLYFGTSYVADMAYLIGAFCLSSILYDMRKLDKAAWLLKYLLIFLFYCKLIRFSFNFVLGYEVSMVEYLAYLLAATAIARRAFKVWTKNL